MENDVTGLTDDKQEDFWKLLLDGFDIRNFTIPALFKGFFKFLMMAISQILL